MERPNAKQKIHGKAKRVFMLLVERMHENMCLGDIFSSACFLNAKRTLPLNQTGEPEREKYIAIFF